MRVNDSASMEEHFFRTRFGMSSCPVALCWSTRESIRSTEWTVRGVKRAKWDSCAGVVACEFKFEGHWGS